MISSPPFILSILILTLLSNVQVQALDKSKQDELIDLRNENIARQKELLHEIGSHLRCYSISKCEYCPEFTDEEYYRNRNDHNEKLSEDEDDNKILGYYVTQFEACLDSRRFEVFECSVVQDEEEQQHRDGGVLDVDYESKPRLKYMKHCRYTEYDEQMNVWVMQVVCTTIGIFALRSVRFQKRKHASLFDQRKMGMPSSRSSRSRNIVTPGSGSKERDRGFMGNLSDTFNRSEIEMLIRSPSSSQHGSVRSRPESPS